MVETELLEDVADTFTEEERPFFFIHRPTGRWHSLLVKWGLRKPEKRYTLKSLNSGNMIRASKALLRIKPDLVDLSNRDAQRKLYEMMVDHLDTVAYIVALALTNTRQQPPNELVEDLKWEVDGQVLLKTGVEVASKLNVTGFFNSMVTIRGMDILTPRKTSPAEPRETIAPGASSEGAQNTSDGPRTT